jgi:hypothetical protein
MDIKLGLSYRLRVFENRMLRRLFGPKREEVSEDWKRLHNEKLCNLCTSPDTIRVIKSRRMCGAGHVSCMGKVNGRDHLEDIGVDGRIIME